MQHIYRILIVDDNEAAAQGLKKLLEYRGHEVRVLHAGAEVLAAASEFQPGVIILDIGLPDIDGYAVASRLRNDLHTDATIIALTGYGQEEDRIRAREAGFDHHLTKPVGLRDIEALLEKRELAAA